VPAARPSSAERTRKPIRLATGIERLATPLLRREETSAMPRPVPMTIPTTAPKRATMTDSERIIARTWRRFIPTARSNPISCVRSNTDSMSVLTIPMSATTTASASRTYPSPSS
jgi:hypothetical protein